MFDENELFRPLAVGEKVLTLPELLRFTADQLEGDGAPESGPSLLAESQAVVDAVSERLRNPRPPEWIEFRLTPTTTDASNELYAAIAECARQELAKQAIDFFFMHKSPGLRIRFRAETPQTHPGEIFAHIEDELDEWVRTNLIASWKRAVYEPEEHLFGGPISMQSVHRIFTLDSLTWLDFWATYTPEKPVWAFSLHVIDSLFENLGIIGWEDRDVWDRIRRVGSRSFGEKKPDGWDGLSKKIRQVWSEPGRLDSVVDLWGKDLSLDFREAVAKECEIWVDNYFTAAHARIGPREAAAYLIIYHWNRSRLAFSWQCAITEALLMGSR